MIGENEMRRSNTLKLSAPECNMLLQIGHTHQQDGEQIFFIPYAFRRSMTDETGIYELIPLPNEQATWSELKSLL